MFLGFWTNPDLMLWYHELEKKAQLQQAQRILRSPEQFQQLLKNLEQRVKNVPNDAKAWFLLGRLRAEKGEWVSAHDAMLQAHRLQPESIKTSLFYVETVWHTQSGLHAYARKVLQDVLVQDPMQPDALMMLAADAKHQHCYQRALVYLNRLISIIPKDTPMYQDLYQEILKIKRKSSSSCELKDE